MEFRPFLLKSHELPHSLGRLCRKRHAVDRYYLHPRGPRGSQSGREKRRDESFQVRAKEPLVPTLTELFPNIQADGDS